MPVVVLFGILVTLGAGRLTAGYEERADLKNWRHEFDEEARGRFVFLERTIASELSAMRGLVSFYDSSHDVQRDEFRSFTAGALRRSTSIRSLAWAPRVSGSDVAAFQAQVRAMEVPGFTVREVNRGGDAPAPAALEEHFPVLYVEPMATMSQELGVDLGADPDRLATLESARDLGELQVSPVLSLQEGGSTEPGMLVVAPVFRHGQLPTSAEDRQSALLGFLVGTYRIRGLIEDASRQTEGHPADTGRVRTPRILELYVYDADQPDNPLLLEASDPAVHGDAPSLTLQQARRGTFLEQNVSVLNRSWIVVARPGVDPVNSIRGGPLSLMMLLAGLSVTTLLAVYLRNVEGQARRVETEVEARTRELARATRELLLSEGRLRAVFESAVDGFLVVAPDGRIRQANAAAERIFGHEEGDLAGVPLLALLPDVGTTPTDPALAHPKVAAERGAVDGRREVSGCRKDGSFVPLDLSVSPLEAEAEGGSLLVVRDITEAKAVERLKDQFISTVSHELRTPLTSIIGSLELVKDGVVGVLPARAERMVEVALDNSERLLWLINDILDIEKLESGRVSLALAPVDAVALTRAASVANQGFADLHGVELGVVDYVEGLQVLGDRDRLMQVLTNLIANAVKFSPLGGEVALGVGTRGDRVVFWVRDAGPGIPEAFRSRVFSPFSQADSSDARRASGTGLGLSIAKSLVEAHDGTIWFETREGEGTTFCFGLPQLVGPGAESADPDTAGLDTANT